MEWINIDECKPQIDEWVLIYCPELNFPYDIMKYKGVATIEDDDETYLIGEDSFVNRSGFLTDDVTHWAELKNPKMFEPIDYTDITDVNGIELEGPLAVSIYQEDDGSYLAEFDIIYGNGNNIDEAVEMLKREIYTLKHNLNEQGDDNLNQKFTDYKDFFNQMIIENDSEKIR